MRGRAGSPLTERKGGTRSEASRGGAVVVREALEADLVPALELRNSVFPAIDPEHWRRTDCAVVAFLGSDVVGVVPFAVRRFVVAPGVVIAAAFANSVCVADGHRGRGIGVQMMEAAREILAPKVDAMFVYTRDETGPQYRFYRRCGYHELLSCRAMARATDADRTQHIRAEFVSLTAALCFEDEILRVYNACFEDFGGMPLREPGYWQAAFASHIFVELPYVRVEMVAVPGGQGLAAYAFAGLREGELVVLEWAVESEAAADGLWGAVEMLAHQWRVTATLVYAQELTGPFATSLARAGFRATQHDEVLVGHVLSFDRLYQAWQTRAATRASVRLGIWTPEREIVLGSDRDHEPEVFLEMKDSVLHRLLLGRANLDALVQTQDVSVRQGDSARLASLSMTLAAVPWAYHHLDYV